MNKKRKQYVAMSYDQAHRITNSDFEQAILDCYQSLQDYVSVDKYNQWHSSNQHRPSILTLEVFAGKDNNRSSWHKVLEEADYYDKLFSDIHSRLVLMHGYYTNEEFAKSTGISQFVHLSSSRLWDYLTDWMREKDVSYNITKKTRDGNGFQGYYVDNGKSYVQNAWTKYGDDVKRLGYPNLFVYWVSTGKNPKTLLACLEWMLNDLTQKESANKYGVTTVSIRNTKNHFQNLDGLPSDLVQCFENQGWNVC